MNLCLPKCVPVSQVQIREMYFANDLIRISVYHPGIILFHKCCCSFSNCCNQSWVISFIKGTLCNNYYEATIRDIAALDSTMKRSVEKWGQISDRKRSLCQVSLIWTRLASAVLWDSAVCWRLQRWYTSAGQQSPGQSAEQQARSNGVWPQPSPITWCNSNLYDVSLTNSRPACDQPTNERTVMPITLCNGCTGTTIYV